MAIELQRLFNHVFADPLAVVMVKVIGVGSHEVDVIQLEPRVGESLQERLGIGSIELVPNRSTYAGERLQFPAGDGLT